MKWIKASERHPAHKNGYYFVKVSNCAQTGHGLHIEWYDGNWYPNGRVADNSTVIEWLDESPASTHPKKKYDPIFDDGGLADFGYTNTSKLHHPDDHINCPTCDSDDTNIETVYRKIVECKKCGDKNYLTDEPEIVHPEEPEGQEEIMKQMAEALRSITTSSRAILGGISKDLMYEVETALAAYDSLTRKK